MPRDSTRTSSGSKADPAPASELPSGSEYPFSTRQRMTNSLELRTDREAAREPHLPTIGEQGRFWDWHWQHWRERNAISDWALKGGDRGVSLLRPLDLGRPHNLDMG